MKACDGILLPGGAIPLLQHEGFMEIVRDGIKG